MSAVDSYVRARIDSVTKKQATEALNAMGLTVSDGIRLFMLRVVDEQRLPFEIKAPSKTTQAANAELEDEKGQKFETADALLADLNAQD